MHQNNRKQQLLQWFKENLRELPWRRNKDPYRIWLSEIILQQTQVKQGLPYFLKFIKLFPTVDDLANANEDTVLKAWEGLGYYSRARNLHYAAKQVSEELKGIFPNNYKDLLTLKGVGDYTASAIASIAFNEAVPTIDGNVNRVISRLYDINKAIDSKEGKNEIRTFILNILDKKSPGDFNQAMMELGALVCKPKNPKCNECPFEEKCLALKNDTIKERPVKQKKINVKSLFIDYLYIRHDNKIALQQRDDKGIWKKMFEFPQVTLDKKPKTDKHLNNLRAQYSSANETIYYIGKLEHKLTHRNLHIRFFGCLLEEKPIKKLFDIEDLNRMAMPKPIVSFIDNHLKNNLFGNV